MHRSPIAVTLLAVLVPCGLAGAASISGAFVGASNAHQGQFNFDPEYMAAKKAFEGAIAGAAVGRDSLEALSLGGLPQTLTYGITGVSGEVSASGNFITAPTVVDEDPQQQGGPVPNGPFSRQATEGSQFLYTELGRSQEAALQFTFEPDAVVRGFGFSVTDLGDFGATLVVSFADGTAESLSLAPGNYGLESDDFANGDHIWAGFTTDAAIASVAVNLTGGTSGDAFSFDEFTVLVVPVPPGVALGALGLLGVAFARRREGHARV